MKKEKQRRISFVSLGCPKNTVDTERLMALLAQHGFLLAEQPEDSDICLVNTCGFIADARQEASEVLSELKTLRRRCGRPRVIAAAGCLVEHADRQGLESFLVDADLCVPFRDYLRLPEILAAAAGERRTGVIRCRSDGATSAKMDPAFHALPRVITGAGHSVSLKISEGCSNGCSFCAIPAIRGRQMDRSMKDIVREAKELVASGAREINLIAQDTSAYGLQRYKEKRLAELLRRLAGEVEEDVWFRLMYVYPGHLDEEMVSVLASDPRFCRYVDIPLQHINDRLLHAMRRPCTKKETLHLLDRLRDQLPGVALRTALIVGFPGETEDEFNELLDFVREEAFDHLGVFTYSPEPGTLACKLTDAVPEEEKLRRSNLVMKIQQELSEEKLRRMKDQVVEVMLDGECQVDEEQGPAVNIPAGRTQGQAPEIDGMVLIEAWPEDFVPQPGVRCRVEITDTSIYDLFGKVC